jgi:hypothetical protein
MQFLFSISIFTSGINHYVTGAKRFKRQAVDDHAKSANHKQAIAIEMTMRVSVFHKESTEKGCSNKSFPGCTLADEGRSPE